MENRKISIEKILLEYEKMREAQRAYFNNRQNPNRLPAMREMEKRVDEMVKEYWKDKSRQPSLF